MKCIEVKMSKRKSTNSVLSFDDTLIDINHWLAEENGENDKIVDNLDEICGEEEEIDSNPSEECLKEEQKYEKPEDNVNRQQRYGSRKQLTRNRNVRNTDSSLDENSYKEIIYMNKDGALKELCDYLGPKERQKRKENLVKLRAFSSHWQTGEIQYCFG